MNRNSNGYRPSVFRLIAPFWASRANWKAWGLAVFALAYSFGSAYLAVWSNRLAGEVMDAMVNRQWAQLWPVLLTTLSVSVGGVLAAIVNYVVIQFLNLEWRTWMTDRYLHAWVKYKSYYQIERDSLLSNADQRISQDIPMFIQDTINLSFDVIRVLVTTVSFVIVLWGLSGTLTFTLFGAHVSIPGYMVYLAFLYQIIAFLITHYTGRPLIKLLSRKQTVEANFRYRGMQLRENAEQIAFYDGGERERQGLSARFGDIIGNWKDIIFCTSRMMFFRDAYVQTGSIVPTLAALPRYLSGAITLGDVTRITGAFNQVSGALSFFTQAYANFSQWLATVHRLQKFTWALSCADDPPEGIMVTRHPGPDLDIDSITLKRPSGEVLVQVSALHIRQGERWLIRGRSGIGKSTFLRAVAGMWPYGEGRVQLPESASLMFLPQRSYIPYGTLRAALCYPAAATQFSDEQCHWAMRECRLSAHITHMDVEGRWQQKLSGGEQQRLAMARVLLHRPAFVFMDEATAAQDPSTEEALYATLIANLPHSAIISVAHHVSLESFHDHMLDLCDNGDEALISPSSFGHKPES